MTQTRDQTLDLWIETKLLHVNRSKRYSVRAYTRYTNTALQLLNTLEMPFLLSRRDDTKYQIEIYGRRDIADSYDDLAYAICRLIFQVITGKTWQYDE